jgi:ATP-dependent DNA helicase DinG
MVDLLKHFPYKTIRPIQEAALSTLEQHWSKYDVFVLSAPTAFGKTAVAKTLIEGLRNVSVITPTNMLVEQFKQEFPDTPTLSRLDSYRCDSMQQSCAKTKAYQLNFCKGCQCGKDLAAAKYRKGPGIYNYHTYLAHKLYRDVLIIDEAHNIIPTIKDRVALTLWQHDLKYPSNAWRPEQILAWALGLPDKKQKTKKVAELIRALRAKEPAYTVQRTKDWFNGKGTRRGEPEERDCLKLLPVDIRGVPPIFWPKETSKIILLSATISKKDIEQLGLANKRVLYINCESPIPADRRPIISVNVATVNKVNLEQSVTDIANYINNIVLPNHQHQKGLIHATYQMAALLRPLLTDKRFMFHTNADKRQVYSQFREAPPDSAKVLVASGMYEGVDLPEDAGRWQVVAKIPWPNLGNTAVKYMADKDPDWYVWQTLKDTMQACGRICRTPTDTGTTIIVDGSFDRLIDQSTKAGLVPAWFLDGINAGEKLK